MMNVSTFSLRFLHLLGLCLWLTAPAALAQTIRYVSSTGTNANPAAATTWATSTTDLQGAINAGAAGDQVWVAAGTYKPGGDMNLNRDLSFALKNGVSVYGGFAGTETTLVDRPAIGLSSPASSTLSGDLGAAGNADNSYNVVRNPAGLTVSAVLDGFVITGGNANKTASSNVKGGGMVNIGASPTVRNCLFQGNTASSEGGGMFNNGSSPVITACSFVANSRGAMSNTAGGNPLVSNCLFERNSNGGANGGGAIASDGSSLTVVNCSFVSNTAGNGGGAVRTYNSTAQLTNCLFQANTTTGASSGGGMDNTGGTVRLTNCSFVGNGSDANAGAISNQYSVDLQALNCSFQGNSARFNGALFSNLDNCTVLLTNCVAYANGGRNTFENSNATSTVTARYCLFDAGVTNYTGTNNLTVSVSPFAGTTTTDLRRCSPAIDAGDPATPALSVGPTDLAGRPRFYNGGPIDMGAYEYSDNAEPISVQNPAGGPITATTPVSRSFTAGGGTGAYTFAVAGGSLPAGLSLSGGGVLSGIASQTGLFPIIVQATDGNGCAGTGAAYQLTVNPPACGVVVFVTPTGAGAQDGSSWANAYVGTSLQLAINTAAACGTDVWVMQGTYRPSAGDRTVSFALKNGVSIYGGFAGTETTLGSQPAGTLTGATASILSGDIGTPGSTADNSYHVVNNPAGLTASAVLDGFVITGGNANGSSANGDGAGMINTGASPTLRNCLFQGNTAKSGGGMFNTANSNVTLLNCSFVNNGGASSQGGAIFNEAGSNIQLTNCSFQGNTGLVGVAMFNTASSPQLSNCVVFGNGGSNTIRNGGGATTTAQYSLFDASVTNYTGSNNLTVSVSPFAGSTTAQLRTGSPAIDAGDPASTPASSGSIDGAGNPRFSGNGRIDMGAYEFQTPLPVTLTYFNGRMTEAGALLGWETAREDNNAFFQIEHSRNAIGFESIGTIPSQAPEGNSLTKLTYSFLDSSPLPGVNYYRLVQTDRDGTRTLHNIIALSKEGQQPVLFPNPVSASGEAVIEPAIAHTGYTLSDVLGRVVQQNNAPGTLSKISLAGLPAGVYLLLVNTESGPKTFRVVK